jgi:hypothetical protein
VVAWPATVARTRRSARSRSSGGRTVEWHPPQDLHQTRHHVLPQAASRKPRCGPAAAPESVAQEPAGCARDLDRPPAAAGRCLGYHHTAGSAARTGPPLRERLRRRVGTPAAALRQPGPGCTADRVGPGVPHRFPGPTSQAFVDVAASLGPSPIRSSKRLHSKLGRHDKPEVIAAIHVSPLIACSVPLTITSTAASSGTDFTSKGLRHDDRGFHDEIRRPAMPVAATPRLRRPVSPVRNLRTLPKINEEGT